MTYEDFKLKVIKCPKCKKMMIDAEYWNLYCVFPKYNKMNLEAQLLERDMVLRSKTKEDYCYLCINCTDKMEFECYGCKETRLRKDIKYKHGSSLEFLCKICYKTKTAEEWSRLKDEMIESHKWDYD